MGGGGLDLPGQIITAKEMDTKSISGPKEKIDHVIWTLWLIGAISPVGQISKSCVEENHFFWIFLHVCPAWTELLQSRWHSKLKLESMDKYLKQNQVDLEMMNYGRFWTPTPLIYRSRSIYKKMLDTFRIVNCTDCRFWVQFRSICRSL